MKSYYYAATPYSFSVLVQPTIDGTADSSLSVPVTSTMTRSFSY